jgi:hypothetical protein
LNGIQEVASSILVSSTTESTIFPLIAWFCLEGFDMSSR